MLDVRKEVQFAVCALEKAVNVPLSRLEVGGYSTAVLCKKKPEIGLGLEFFCYVAKVELHEHCSAGVDL